MGLKEEYRESLRMLFPRGEYWETQWANSESDCNKWIEAKLSDLLKLRRRMNELLNESVINTAEETIEDWERVLLNSLNSQLSMTERRMLLNSSQSSSINIEVIRIFASLYGVTVHRLEIPYRSSFYGFNRYAIHRTGSPSVFSVLFLYASTQSEAIRIQFESLIAERLLANYTVFFFYGGE